MFKLRKNLFQKIFKLAFIQKALQPLNSSRGSFTGAIIALGILGVVITGLLTYMQRFEKISRTTSEQVNFNPQFLSMVLGNMKFLLMDSAKDSAGISTAGVCKLIVNAGSCAMADCESGEDVCESPACGKNGTWHAGGACKGGATCNGTDKEACESNTSASCAWLKCHTNRKSQTECNVSKAVCESEACGKHSWISKTLQVKKNVQEIKLDLGRLEGNVPEVKLNWPSVFPMPEWEEATSTTDLEFCKQVRKLFESSNLAKCYKYKGITDHARSIYTVAEIVPTLFPKGEKILEDSSVDDKQLARKVMFLVKAHIGIVPLADDSGETSRKISYINSRSDIIWANSAGNCTISDGSEKLVVRLSASAMLGEEDGIINAQGNHDNSCTGFQIGSIRPHASAGVSAFENQTVSKDIEKAVKLACTTKEFVCKGQTLKAEHFNEAIQFIVPIHNKTGRPIKMYYFNNYFRNRGGNNLRNGWYYPTSSTKPIILTHSSALNLSFYANGDIKTIGSVSKSKNPIISSDVATDPLPADTTVKLNIPPGDSYFKVTLKGSFGNKSIQQICASLCSTLELNKITKCSHSMVPNIRVKLDDPIFKDCNKQHIIFHGNAWRRNNDLLMGTNFCGEGSCEGANPISPKTEEKCNAGWRDCESAACGNGTWVSEHFAPLECISCNARACHRFGGSTVAKMNKLNTEAVDHQFPECQVKNKYSDTRNIAYESDDNLNNENGGNAQECIALKTLTANTTTIANWRYEAKSCTSSFPVLCFAGGKYQLAKAWNKDSETFEVQKVPHTSAQSICRDMGKEIIDEDEWDEMEVNSAVTVTSNSGKYTIINNKTRGLFLAPSGKLDKEVEGISSTTHVWVAMEQDKGGLIVPSSPDANIAGDVSVLHKDHKDQANLKSSVENDADSADDSTISEANKAYTLAYSRKWKGLRVKDKTASSSSFPFICQKSLPGCANGRRCNDATCTKTQCETLCKWEKGCFKGEGCSTYDAESACTGHCSWDTSTNACTGGSGCDAHKSPTACEGHCKWSDGGECTGGCGCSGLTAEGDCKQSVCTWAEKGDFFISGEQNWGGVRSQGMNVCQGQNGWFVPPENSLDYSKAMLLLKEQFQADLSKPAEAWIALDPSETPADTTTTSTGSTSTGSTSTGSTGTGTGSTTDGNPDST